MALARMLLCHASNHFGFSFEKPPWMKISSRTLPAVHSGCWPTGCGSDTQAAARHWQSAPVRPVRSLSQQGRPYTSPSCRTTWYPLSDARRFRVNASSRFFRRPTAPHAIRGTMSLRRCLVATGNGWWPERLPPRRVLTLPRRIIDTIRSRPTAHAVRRFVMGSYPDADTNPKRRRRSRRTNRPKRLAPAPQCSDVRKSGHPSIDASI